MGPKTITLDVWNTPPGECEMTGLKDLPALELAYLYREVRNEFYRQFGKSPEEFLEGMSTLLAPAD